MTMVLAVFLVFGSMAYFGLSLELFPDVEIGFVTVRTIYPGSGPREIETQVSKKIEDAVSTISKIDWIRSYSMDSVSIVLLKFELGKSPDIAVQEVKDKLDAILNDLPGDADTPIVEKMDLRAEPVLDILLSGKLNLVQLRELADKKLKDRFAQIEGVARVDLAGGMEREIRVELDNRVVVENAISLAQLSQILKVENMDMPGGQFQQQSQEYSVRFEGELDTIDALKELKVPTGAGMKKLGKIAEILDSGAEVRERTVYFDNQSKLKQDSVVLLSIIKSADGNTVDMVRKIRERLPEIERDLPPGNHLTIINDRSVMIESSVEDTLMNIFLGVVLTAFVLLFFLHDIRSTIIAALAMPFSIVSTFMLMQVSGFSLNMMTLMGLSTAVGILVTNSVVVLENIFRHKELGKSRKEAAGKGTSEIAVAVIASTLTNIVVFLPIASMSSMVGQFFKEFALTVTFATIFSLIVSFTLTPMLASLILPEHDKKKHPIGERLEKMFHAWERVYEKILSVVLATRWRSFGAILVAVGIFFLSFISAGRVGFEFVPTLDEGKIRIDVELPQGYNLDETSRLISKIESRIAQNEEVESIVTQIGSITSTDVGVNLAKVTVDIVDVEKRDFSAEEAANRYIRELSDIPNARIRVAAVAPGMNEDAPIQFFLMGQDVDQLETYKDEIIAKLKKVDGLVNLSTSSRPGKPEIMLTPDREKLKDAGLTVMDLALTLRGAVEGLEATTFKEGGEEYDIRVCLNGESVDTPEKIGNIAVVAQSGVYRLSQLATVRFVDGYSKILHNDKYKAIEFNGYPAPGTPLGAVVERIRESIASVDLPTGYKVNWSGDAEMMEEAMIDMLTTFIIAILLTYMLLAAVLESFTQPLMILGTVPMAMIGVFYAMDISGKNMNIMSMMAIIMLLGIVVNNAILLLDYTNMLRKQGMSVTEALLEACPTRLKPILMATIAIILGMLPMAMGIGSAGKEFREPMGIVSIGGLIASAALTLIIIPAIYNLTVRRKKEDINEPEENQEEEIAGIPEMAEVSGT